MNQHIVSINDFKWLSIDDDIKAIVKQYNTVVAAPRWQPHPRKEYHALAFWVFDEMRRQLDLNVNEWDNSALGAAVNEIKWYKEWKEKVEMDSATMDKIETGLK